MGTQNFRIICRIGVCLLFAAAFFGCGGKTADNIPTGKVTRGTFFVDLYEEGEIAAVNSITISSPNVFAARKLQSDSLYSRTIKPPMRGVRVS